MKKMILVFGVGFASLSWAATKKEASPALIDPVKITAPGEVASKKIEQKTDSAMSETEARVDLSVQQEPPVPEPTLLKELSQKQTDPVFRDAWADFSDEDGGARYDSKDNRDLEEQIVK
jgi:hypothetical protein